MKDYQKLKGLIAATFTPMGERGEVVLAPIEGYADYIASLDVDGVFVCGTTGESLSLTTGERMAILEAWLKYSKGRFKVIAHVGSNSQEEAVALARHAQESGAYAIGSMSPSFFKPATVKELVDFFVPVAEAAGELPFYYYHMPSITGVNLPVSSFLSEGGKVIPNLAGVKFTDNNLMELGKCIALEQGKYEVLNGYDEILIAGVAFGAKAGVGSTYNYIPQVYSGIFKAMEERNIDEARQLQLKSIEIVDVLIKYGGGVRAGKAIMNLIGIECGPCRLPISPFTDEEYESMRKDLTQIGLLK